MDKQKHIVIDARIRRAGTGRYVDRLLEHLQNVDQVNRYSVLLEPDDPWRPKAANYRVRPCKYRQFSFNPLEQFGFARQLYKLKPDLMHFSMTQQPIFFLGTRNLWNASAESDASRPSRYARSRGCAIVCTTHDLTMFTYARAGRLNNWLHALRLLGYRFLFWWGHRKSRRIIVPSHYVANALAERQPFTKPKIVVTYEAAEPIQGEGQRVKGIEKPFILHVGSPFPHKNIERLVEAFTRLKTDNPELKLVLAGKKEHYSTVLQKHIKTVGGLTSHSVVFPGRVSDAELKWLYEHAEAYVLPSLSEGFGLPGLEAMVHDCPLVSSNATCLPEIYANATHYFNPTSVEDMGRAINEVLNDKALRSKLIALGSAQAAKYSWKKMAQETLEIYSEVLSE